MSSEIFVEGGMHYECEECGEETIMWLEEGLETPGVPHKPVPYIIKCPACGGYMKHVRWNEDIRLPGKMPINKDTMNRFENRKDSDCGVPVFAKKEKK